MSWLAARRDEARVAVMLLTRLPAGQLRGTVPGLDAARWAFPLVGALLGGLVWVVFAGTLALGGAPALAALLALGALALLTGALHFDGLADCADGLGGGRDRAHALEIMRDSRIGSYGVLALGLVAGLWAVAVSGLGPAAGAGAFVAMASVSRAGMVALLETLPPARPDGLGRMAGGPRPAAQVVAGLSVLAALWPLGPWPVLAMLVTVALVGWRARARIGGQTGDVLGAAQLTSETAGWVALALVLA
ncbi:adenosylcobinamide-GDP ribazoletransferase [Pseudoponticoccus marisrubri]|uniref:Adenosylcobinamide-GDP ribazoletransferase n=1 Tax=Pseudoponticoccus marisrubri TaxID=1685382 RepID=A0A0W7WII0_9RHOB|nr:adenosylcobinamide-GDP ribazoletransferase [Pseudoponticoccus marisrubri]KUF10361.1 hypothetical protein AVJ23_13255 [Pseudoponticoccus marisrubri]